MTCIDIGASTGGFTDVLLRRGAGRVYAVDVGHGQLHDTLREDERVVSLEKLNARDVSTAAVPQSPDLVVCDVSFVSLKLALPATLSLCRPGTVLVALIKPQFEVGRERLGKGGIVRDTALHELVCAEISEWIATLGWRVIGIEPSPVEGPDGNREFLLAAGVHMKTQLVIDHVAHLGEGAAVHDGTTVYVRGALAGETVSAELDGPRGQLLKVIEPAADRIKPPCGHFPQCGGCTLQHMERGAYLEWKRLQVEQALRAQGIDTAVGPVIAIEPGTRRRATFAARRTKRGVRFGFNVFRSSEIVDLEQCPVLVPEIVSAVPTLREALAPMLTRRGVANVQVTAGEAGLDVFVTGGRAAEDVTAHQDIAALAERLDLARLSWNGEVIAERRKPVQTFGTIAVTPPAGGFLQAARPAEAAIVDCIAAGLCKASNLIDLFSGAGALSLPFAPRMRIHAVEADAKALAALTDAVNHAQGIKPVTSEERDLFKRPLLAGEFEPYDAILFDPPRAGAKAQCEEIAQSFVPVVVAVSCNPATFARDARALTDGGYRLESVTPVDQFLFSPHIELVGVLSKV